MSVPGHLRTKPDALALAVIVIVPSGKSAVQGGASIWNKVCGCDERMKRALIKM